MVLPLGELTKREVYELAAEMGIQGFNQQESQDVCFLGGNSVASCLEDHGIKRQPGDIVSTEGRILGQHQGIWHYTIGQRRGLGLPDATPWYVTGLDGVANRVIVGKHEELFSRSLKLSEVLWSGEARSLPWYGVVQLRSRHQPEMARITAGDDPKSLEVLFDQPQRAVTPGQFAAFYEDEMVVGSGIIAAAENIV